MDNLLLSALGLSNKINRFEERLKHSSQITVWQLVFGAAKVASRFLDRSPELERAISRIMETKEKRRYLRVINPDGSISREVPFPR